MSKQKFKTIKYTAFGQTKLVRAELHNTDGEYDETMWCEKGEDLYALMSHAMRGKRVAIVYREDWLRARPIEGV